MDKNTANAIRQHWASGGKTKKTTAKAPAEKNGGNGGGGNTQPITNPTVSTVSQKAYDTFNSINDGSFKNSYMEDSYINNNYWLEDENIDPRAKSVLNNMNNNGLANKIAENPMSSMTVGFDNKGNSTPLEYNPSLGEQMNSVLNESAKKNAKDYYQNKGISDSDLVYRYLYDQGLSDNDMKAVIGMLQDQEDANYAANPDYERWGIMPNNIGEAYQKAIYGDDLGPIEGGGHLYSGGYANQKQLSYEPETTSYTNEDAVKDVDRNIADAEAQAEKEAIAKVRKDGKYVVGTTMYEKAVADAKADILSANSEYADNVSLRDELLGEIGRENRDAERLNRAEYTRLGAAANTELTQKANNMLDTDPEQFYNVVESYVKNKYANNPAFSQDDIDREIMSLQMNGFSDMDFLTYFDRATKTR